MKRILAYRDRVAAELQAAIRRQAAVAGRDNGWDADFFERLEPFAASGKLLRGCLVCFAYEMFGVAKPDATVYKAAAAVELAHSSLLIHDDIMDRDDLRRGQPSMHRQYARLGSDRQVADSERFGSSLAICGGDAGLLLAFRLMSEVQASAANATAGRVFADQLLQVCAGQMQDVYFDAVPELPAKAAIMALMQAKTAAYTVALPLSLGATLAGQPPDTVRELRAFGESAGTIYQIRDDELGLTGDPAVTGKQAGSDVRQHKKTLIYYFLLQKAAVADKSRIEAIFSKPDVSDDDIADMRELVREYDVASLLAAEIDRLQKRASGHLEALTISSAVRLELLALLEFCAARPN